MDSSMSMSDNETEDSNLLAKDAKNPFDKKPVFFCKCFLALLALSLIANVALVGMLLSAAAEKSSSYETGFASDLASIKHRIELIQTRYTGGVELDHAGHFSTDASGPQYVGNPSKVIDLEWEKLLSGLNLDLTDKDIGSTATFQWPESGMHLTGLEVYHSLHCLPYTIEILSVDPFVIYINDFLSEYEIQYLLEYAPSDNKSKHGAGVEEAESLMDSYSGPNTKGGIVSKLNSFFITLKDVLLFTLLVGILVLVATQQSNTVKAAVTSAYTPAGALPGCNCGASIKQALELDCKYDSLASAWLPPHCRDDELTAMFDRAGPGVNGSWKYWADEDFTREISLQDVSRLAEIPGSLYYTSHRWH
ncbi:hypothetical protein ARSEF4850_009698, partial [Beauveria asiatica]